MARRIVSMTTLTPAAFSDATNISNGAFPFFIVGGTATQQVKIHEISLLGQAASSSSPTFMILSRQSTIAATATTFAAAGGSDAPLDTATAALTAATTTGNSSTSLAQSSATLHLLNLSLNAFGGINFWRANKWDECPTLLGVAANVGGVSLFAWSGGTPGAIGSHGIYESL